jgi:hypothetical protein
MDRYRSIGPSDDPSLVDGDDSWLGVDEYSTAENIAAGLCQQAVNVDFTSGDAVTRGGFVCIPELGLSAFNASSSWEERTSAVLKSWCSIAYGDGRFVAVVINAIGVNDIMYSSDGGLTWTAVSTGFGSSQWRSVTFGNNTFVVVGTAGTAADRVATSPDGINWTLRTAASASAWQSVTFGNGVFVAVHNSAGTSQVMTSSDSGVTWTARTTPTAQSGFAWTCVTYGNSVFVAGNAQGTALSAMRSTDDGVTWTEITTAIGFQAVAYGGSRFVSVTNSGGNNQAMTSDDDGVTWTQRATITGGSYDWNAITYGNGLFVAVNSTNTADAVVMSSPNGANWTAASTPNTYDYFGVAYGAGTFVAPAFGSAAVVIAKTFYTTPNTTGSVLGTGSYSDPDDPGSLWTMLVGSASVGFYAFGKTSHTVNYTSGQTVTALSTIVQADNQVFIFRGINDTPLVWDGNWGTKFELATGTVPNSPQALFYQNRLWTLVPKDSFYASDVLDFTAFTEITNQFNLSTGDSNYVVTSYPFGSNTIIVFKNKSIMALTSVDGALTDVVATEITRQVGAIGINAVVTVGPDLAYVSDKNINLLSLTATNNAVQHKILPLSAPIKKILARVNWQYGYKISLGYLDNKLYVALPLDNSTVCNAVVVYNFISQTWFGEWTFNASLGMAILGWNVGTYLGLQRMHAITEDGRIFITDEGPQDIAGTNVFEIATSLTTRAYAVNNNNRMNRRMWADIGTWRPKFTVTGYVDGVSESSVLLEDQEYSRSQSWIFNDSTYSLTNSGDNYNREGRKDYAGYCSDNIQAKSGFLPEATQEYRYPLLFRRAGRTVWIKVENTQGKISINGIGTEARAGSRGNLVQVI